MANTSASILKQIAGSLRRAFRLISLFREVQRNEGSSLADEQQEQDKGEHCKAVPSSMTSGGTLLLYFRI